MFEFSVRSFETIMTYILYALYLYGTHFRNPIMSVNNIQ